MMVTSGKSIVCPHAKGITLVFRIFSTTFSLFSPAFIDETPPLKAFGALQAVLAKPQATPPHRPAEVPSSKCPVWHRLEQLHGQATWAHLCRQTHPALAIVLHLKDQGARTHSSSTHHCKESPTTTKHFFQSSSRGPTHGCCVVVLTSGMSSHASPSTAPSESHPRRSQRRPWSRTLCCSQATMGVDAGMRLYIPYVLFWIDGIPSVGWLQRVDDGQSHSNYCTCLARYIPAFNSTSSCCSFQS